LPDGSTAPGADGVAEGVPNRGLTPIKSASY
jgi:hypothetical protein